FSVLVVVPVRHWWAYILAAYFTSVITELRAGFPLEAFYFIGAGVCEISLAALGVRRFAEGLRAFDSLRNLLAYVVVAVILAPFAGWFGGRVRGGDGVLLFLLARLVSSRAPGLRVSGTADPHLDRYRAHRHQACVVRSLPGSVSDRRRVGRDRRACLPLADG